MKFQTKIIELFGLPRTGKTTGLKAIKEFLVNKGFSIQIVRERASVCPIENKLHPYFNYWTAISFMKEYIEANDKGVDFILADRGIFDAFVWVNLFADRGEAGTKKEFLKLINQNFIMSNYFETYFFESSIDIIMNREYDRQVKKRTGRIMNPNILNGYLKSFQEIESQLEKWCNIYKIETSRLSIPETISELCIHLEKTIANKC